MKTKTFEDFLKEKHAEQYTGLEDLMVDDYYSWLYNELSTDDIIRYVDEYINQIVNGEVI